MKAVRSMSDGQSGGWDLWWKGFVEEVCSESGVEESESDGESGDDGAVATENMP